MNRMIALDQGFL
ncbi:hypothetical protein Zm00014a_009658 [Zea mays]|uniref:Uncharacterized protein n=1 Tax=Zea mays TaxID=4577 RepID=A0A3L6DWD3_MAIZE|nr:hypothetical protein Zm00014a_009658 [Zea mays]